MTVTRSVGWWWVGGMGLTGLIWPVSGAMGASPSPAASIVSISGVGQFRADERGEWAAARVDQPLAAGQFVRTGDYSRMGVLFRDRTQLRLNEKTVLQVRDGEAETRLRLEVGRAWTQSKTPPGTLYMETPSATAAIRGTDWDLEVDGNGRSVLTVLSGEIEFYNPQGRITVHQNEAAEARVGSAPTRLIFVRPRDRVQWVTAYALEPLRHITLSSPGAAAQGEPGQEARLLADRGDWSAAAAAFAAGDGDWLGAGFAALYRGDLAAARAGFARVAGGPPLSPAEAERLSLGQAALAIQSQDLGRAREMLQALIRGATLYQPAAYLLLADLAIYGGDLAEAGAYLAEGQQRFPGSASLLAAKARVALLQGDTAAGHGLAAQALAADGASLPARLAEGDVARIAGEAEAARGAYAAARTSHPEDDRPWFGLGRVETEEEAVAAGRRDLGEALIRNPRGPGYQGELGTLESFANDFAAARAAFDAALAANPDDYVALTGLGLLALKAGQPETALDYLLRAGLLEPRYARAQVYTGVAYYQLGRVPQALAALGHASELDDKDPLPYLLASVIHTDTLEPALAIADSRAALARLPYLKSLNQLANDQQGINNLGQAFAFLGMEEWARHYAQDSYYPFWAGSHLFLADRYPGLFAKNSELFQGFLTDPTVFGGSNRAQTLLPRPVNNLSLSQRVSSIAGLMHGTGPDVQASGFANSVMPVAYFLDREVFDLHFNNGPWKQSTTTAALGLVPRHDVGVFLYGDDSTLDTRSEGGSPTFGEHLNASSAYLGFNYKLSPTSQVWVKTGEFSSSDGVRGNIVRNPFAMDTSVSQPESGFRHTFALSGSGGRHEFTWGAETGRRLTRSDFAMPDQIYVGDSLRSAYDFNERSQDAYVSDRWQGAAGVLVQGDLFYQSMARQVHRSDTWNYGGRSLDMGGVAEDLSRRRWNPRLGVALGESGGLRGRFALQRWTRPALFSSLGPVATAGIPLEDRLVMRGGDLTQVRAQGEWEYSPRSFFTAYAEHQRIDNHRFSITTPFAVNDLESLGKLRPRRFGSLANDDLLEFSNTPEYGGGRISTLGLTVNHLLTEQWGLFGRYLARRSENTGPTYGGNAVPYLPARTLALGATWVDPGGWYFISRMVHRSLRYSDEANTNRLEPGWSGAFDLFWQSRDKQWLLRLSADDTFDRNKTPQYTAEVNLRF